MTNASIVPTPGGGFVRGSVDISDAKPTPLLRFFEHHELLAVYTRAASYVVVVMGPASASAAMQKLVEDAMVTTRVAHPVPAYEGRDVSEELGRFTRAGPVVSVTSRGSRRPRHRGRRRDRALPS